MISMTVSYFSRLVLISALLAYGIDDPFSNTLVNAASATTASAAQKDDAGRRFVQSAAAADGGAWTDPAKWNGGATGNAKATAAVTDGEWMEPRKWSSGASDEVALETEEGGSVGTSVGPGDKSSVRASDVSKETLGQLNLASGKQRRHLQSSVFVSGTMEGADSPDGLSACPDDEYNGQYGTNLCTNGCESQFYEITGTGSNITVSLCGGTTWDSRLNIREVSTTTCSSICLASQDDGCGSGLLSTIVTWTSTLGVKYLIHVTTFKNSTEGGAFNMTVSGTSETPTLVATPHCPTPAPTPALVGGCPPSYSSYDGHRYAAMFISNTWTTANMLAQTYSCCGEPGHLAVIGDINENAFIRSILSGTKGWIGYTDSAMEGTWLTIFDESLPYSNWNTNEPNNFNGNEDCAEMESSGLWNDSPCSESRGAFVIEFDCPSTSAPSIPQVPSVAPTLSSAPTAAPTAAPTMSPTTAPTMSPTAAPTMSPTTATSMSPMTAPTTATPTMAPTSAPTSICPGIGNMVTYDGHLYAVVSGSITGTDAIAAAQSYRCCGVDGHLVIIEDADENNFVGGIVGIGNRRWIGYTDVATEGTWLTVSGDPLSYSYWNTNEPNNFNGNEDCAEMDPSGRWNDCPCSESRGGYVIEFDCSFEPTASPRPTSPPTSSPTVSPTVTFVPTSSMPTSAPTGICSGVGNVHEYNDHWYIIVDSGQVNWYEAVAMAQSLNCCGVSGHLPTISDSHENAFVQSMVQYSDEFAVWMGLNDVYTNGTFTWTNGNHVEGFNETFTNFDDNVLVDPFDNTCFLFFSDGLWSLGLDCSETLPFERSIVEFDCAITSPTSSPTLAPIKSPTLVPTDSPRSVSTWLPTSQRPPTTHPSLAPSPATPAPVITAVTTCNSAKYIAWIQTSSGRLRTSAIKNKSTICINHPYNIRVHPTCASSLAPALPVVIRLLNRRRKVIRKQVDSTVPYLLWGKVSGNTTASPKQLPNGVYYLKSSFGGEIKFTQKCSA